METTDSVEIIGLSDTPVTVDSNLNVTQSGAVPEQDIAAEMAAAIAADSPQESKEAAKEPAAEADEEKPAEEAKVEVPAAKADEPEGEKTGDEKPTEKPTTEEKPTVEEPIDDKAPVLNVELEGVTEEKPDEKPEEKPEEVKAEEPEAEAEPSETDKLVEEMGGVDVLKAAQPFVDSVYDPDLPVSERVSRLEAFVPEAQMKEMRNEVFWQAAETPEIQDLLAADPAARETFAEKVFGVPFGYLEKIFNDDKAFLSEDEFTEAIAEFKEQQPEAKPEAAKAKAPAAKAEAKPEKKEQPKKPAEEEKNLTPAFTDILDNLSTDVDEIFSTAKLEPNDKDDAETTRLKTAAAKQFETEWPKAFMADEAAMKAYRAVKGLADQGAEKQARDKYPVLSKSARRVAAQLLEKISEPLSAHRKSTQERAKVAAAARTESPAAAKETTILDAPTPASAKGLDVSTLRTEADITRAMEEAIERNSKKA
ncbi:MAG: hypothetical protein ACR2HX_06130 [Pyrinomonadaceae bacterium]